MRILNIGRTGFCRGFAVIVAGLLFTASALAADAPTPAAPPADPNAPHLNTTPTVSKLGDVAEVTVPVNHVFFGAARARQIMEESGNKSTGLEQGLIIDGAGHGLVLFEFDPIGYVKDSEGASLDADAILESIRAGNEEGNTYRKAHGQPALNITGWQTKPLYNPVTHNLEWCVAAESEGKPVLNHNIRVLGRGGVMEVTLICDPAALDGALADTRSLLGGFKFLPGHTYAEWKSGDKVAEYGLAALVAGGAAAVAIKSGLLAKLLKPILVGLAVIGGWVAKTWNKITGRNKQTQA